MNEIEKRKGEVVLMIQQLNPGYSTCYKCGLPWNHCTPKSIKCNHQKRMFALCSYCWDNSTIEERIHHYKSLFYDNKNMWGSTDVDFAFVENEIRIATQHELLKQ
jgi:hypothetical protein